VDEEPQIRVVKGTAPVLPVRPRQLERSTHDYLRHSTWDLFAV
jgi:hypothetical protein